MAARKTTGTVPVGEAALGPAKVAVEVVDMDGRGIEIVEIGGGTPELRNGILLNLHVGCDLGRISATQVPARDARSCRADSCGLYAAVLNWRARGAWSSTTPRGVNDPKADSI